MRPSGHANLGGMKMTLKLHGIIEEPKEEVTQPKTQVKEETVNTESSPVESAGYLTPEEIIAISADKVE